MHRKTKKSRNGESARRQDGELVGSTRVCRAIAALLFVTTLVAGCSTTRKAPLPEPVLVWPPAPNAPRIQFVQNIYQPGDLGIRPSGMRRLANWIIGSDKGREGFLKPFGVALDENGNICVTDTGASSVIYIDRAKKRVQRWERVGKLRFDSPVAIARQNGVFYVADSGLGSVLAFDESGQLRSQITQHLERPSGVVLARDRLFVADAARHRIVAFDLAGNFLFEFGARGSKPGEFNYPTHIAADANGDLFVTDSMNSRVQVFDNQGAFKNQIGALGDSTGQFSRPKGVAVDGFGHVYVIDALFDNVQIFDHTGTLLLNLGEAGKERGQFWLPNGIAIGRANEIFVADCYNRRLQMFRYIGKE